MLPNEAQRLSRLETCWALVNRCHTDDPGRREAMAELLPRYCQAVYRYLLVVVEDEASAEELCQEFAFRFVGGAFRHARPERGRFRDYVKISVLHLVQEFQRTKQARDRLVPLDSRILAVVADPGPGPEERFQREWAAGLVNRAWAALRAESEESGSLTYEALRLRAADPKRRSAEIAATLSEQSGRPLTPAAVRQMLHRGRERLGELLRREVAESLPSIDPDEVAAELADLGLADYCRNVEASPG